MFFITINMDVLFCTISTLPYCTVCSVLYCTIPYTLLLFTSSSSRVLSYQKHTVPCFSQLFSTPLFYIILFFYELRYVLCYGMTVGRDR